VSKIIPTDEGAVVIPIEAYVSEAYAKAENEKLWPKVWQIACRVEELPKVGDYVTYDNNMPQVQKGMKSRGYVGARPSPVQEVAVIHFHRLLSKYMGTGAPTPI
jgi:hypothetical protein